MKQLYRVLLVLALSWSTPLMAAIIGPVDDGLDHLGSGPVSKWIQTTWKSGNLKGNDLIHIKKNGEVDVYVQVNMVVTLPEIGTVDDAILTTIYGKQAPGAPLTGFDPGDGISFDTMEQHIGSSGALYDAYEHASVLAVNLPAYLTGVDLSGFDTLSSTQQYEIFRTKLPVGEITPVVPEPGTFTLGLVAAGMAGCVKLRRKSGRRQRAQAQPSAC